jgi:hypothetical protein
MRRQTLKRAQPKTITPTNNDSRAPIQPAPKATAA